MHPVLFKFEWLGRTFVVKAYAAGFAAAAVVLVLASLLIAGRRGGRSLAATVALCLLVGVPASLVGGRLLYWATNRSTYATQPNRLFSFGLGDFSMFGGLGLAAVVVLLVCRWRRVSPWLVADTLTPGAAAAIAALKVGCFLHGCCFGTRCDRRWAVTFPHGSAVHLHQIRESAAAVLSGPRSVHPVQLYEAGAAAVAAFVAGYLILRRAEVGRPFLLAAMVYCTCRLLVGPVRPMPPTFTGPDWLFPAIYAGLIGSCILLFAWRWPRTHSRSNDVDNPMVVTTIC